MTNTSKTVVFFGNEKLATGLAAPEPVIKEAIRKAGFEIEQIVTGPPKSLQQHSSQIAVLAAYGHIVSSSLLEQFPLGIINVHPSLLPQYRGPTPIEQAILDGVTKTGVSIMKLSSRMDEGPLYKQKTIHLHGTESKAELTSQLQQLGADLIYEVLPLIVSGALKPRQQPHPQRATYSRKLVKEDGIIDWQKPAEVIERELRAYLGWPGSRTVLFDKEVTITEAIVAEGKGTPGTLHFTKKELLVYCGKGALNIKTLKPAGKKEMDVVAFLAGYSPR